MRAAAALLALTILAGCSTPDSGRSLSPSPAPASRFKLVPLSPMGTPRAVQTSTLLADGRVLVAGGCTDDGCNLGSTAGATSEVFDPVTRSFQPTGRMSLSRDDHQAVRLRDGRVLIAGGWTAAGVTKTTELYDPHAGSFSPGPDMRTGRAGFTAVALADGRVLLAGGEVAAHVDTATAEIFDPQAGTIQSTGDMTLPRSAHAATLLLDGRVLVAGGTSRGSVVDSAEVYNPATGRFTRVGSMHSVRYKAGSVTLADGRGFIIGGAIEVEAREPLASTELFNPATNSFVAGPTMGAGRYKLIDSVILLGGGDVVVAGGAPRPEIYDAQTMTFETVDGTLGSTRMFLTATAIDGARALLVGGYDKRIRPTAEAWLIE